MSRRIQVQLSEGMIRATLPASRWFGRRNTGTFMGG